MFLIPAAIFEGYYSWGDYLINFIPVWLGNFVGGALFVGMAYGSVYLKNSSSDQAVPRNERDAALPPSATSTGNAQQVHSTPKVS